VVRHLRARTAQARKMSIQGSGGWATGCGMRGRTTASWHGQRGQ
jgi:hypothetical protein